MSKDFEDNNNFLFYFDDNQNSNLELEEVQNNDTFNNVNPFFDLNEKDFNQENQNQDFSSSFIDSYTASNLDKFHTNCETLKKKEKKKLIKKSEIFSKIKIILNYMIKLLKVRILKMMNINQVIKKEQVKIIKMMNINFVIKKEKKNPLYQIKKKKKKKKKNPEIILVKLKGGERLNQIIKNIIKENIIKIQKIIKLLKK